jgi:processive 1,2-diacylglycerol beta-glucosyltransferase
MEQKKILICYSDAGNGPVSASEALRDTLQLMNSEESLNVSIIDVLKETTSAGFLTVRIYNYLLGKSLKWNALFLKLFYKSRLVSSGALLKPTANKLAEVFAREKPSVLVFTNPWIIGYGLRAVKKLPADNRPKCISLVIDLGTKILPPSWYQKDIDLFIVPTPEAKEQLVTFGAARDKIMILGMPVRPSVLGINGQFSDSLREQQSNGIANTVPHVLVMAGRSGTRNTVKIVKELLELREKFAIRMTVLCGQNLQLQRRVKEVVATWRADPSRKDNRHGSPDRQRGAQENGTDDILVEGYVPDVYSYMRQADLLITKPGALTVSEAIVLKLPMILDIDPAIMGQEMGNVEYIRSRGMGLVAEKIHDIPALVERYFNDENLRMAIKKNIHSNSDLAGTARIAEAILTTLKVGAKSSIADNS